MGENDWKGWFTGGHSSDKKDPISGRAGRKAAEQEFVQQGHDEATDRRRLGIRAAIEEKTALLASIQRSLEELAEQVMRGKTDTRKLDHPQTAAIAKKIEDEIRFQKQDLFNDKERLQREIDSLRTELANL
jgi:HPt (histidine-containing phosphotransfer) domain-containing protein